MNRKIIRVMNIIIFLLILVIPASVYATDEKLSTVLINGEEYVIYIENYTDREFKYALSNNADTEEIDLIYNKSIEDMGGNQIAYIDARTYKNLVEENEPIYIWVKDEEENLIIEAEEIDFQNSISREEIETVETTTKRILVEIGDTKEKVEATEPIREEEINGVKEISKVGYIKITDNEEASYYYELVNIKNLEEYKELKEMAEEINEKYDELDMYKKIEMSEKFYNLYSKLVEEAKWQEVENMTIVQPEESVEGDEYIALIRKVEEGKETVDVQFLTAYDDYEEEIIKEEIVTEETTKLPITYDSIALIVILGIIVIALVVVFIKIKRVSKKNNEIKKG